MSQNQQILKYLKQGNTLTPRGSMQMFGCYRLSARIYELRRMGERIDNIGKRFAEYKWVKPQMKASDFDIMEALASDATPKEICEELGITKQSLWERIKRLYVKGKIKGCAISGWYQRQGIKQSNILMRNWDEKK